MAENTVTKVAADDIAADRRRGGAVRVLLSPRTVASTSGFGGLLTLDAGEYVAEHTHPYSEEFVYLVEGSVVMRVGDEEVDLHAGEALMVPIGERHRIRNGSDRPARAVFHLGPLAPRPELGHVDLEEGPPVAADSLPAEVGGAS